MSEPFKISIRFFNDREVRAVWDDTDAKWWFSVLDVVAVLNEENDYQRVRNYWKYLKAKLKKENIQLGSATNQLKLIAKDGKKYNTDLLNSEGITALAKHFPNNKSMSKISKDNYMNAMIISTVDYEVIGLLLARALTDKINDRETFMKGIDYSYYYEE